MTSLPLASSRQAAPTTPSSASTIVQYFTYQTAASSVESSSTVSLGTGGSAHRSPASGDLLVALVGYGDTGSGATITPPAGFTAASGGALSNYFGHQAVFTAPVGSSAPSSLTFRFSEQVSAQIWVVEASATGIDVITTSKASAAGAPWLTSTGAGTQSGLNDVGLVFVTMADAPVLANPLSGYTALGSTLWNHGDGSNSWGSSSAVFVSNTPVTTANVPAQNVGWSSGDGTEMVMGAQILLRNGSGTGSVTAPVPSSAPTGGSSGSAAPSVVQSYTYQTAASSVERSSTVSLGTNGTAGHAPAAGDLLVALVGYGDTGSGATITPPAGFTAAAGGTVSNAFTHEAVFTATVGGAAPGSLTFGFSESVSAQIWIADMANASGIDVITSATGNPSGSPWSTSTGSGTQSGANDVGLVFVSMADAPVVASALSGYTQLGSTLWNHGDGSQSYGSSSAVFRANAPLTSGSVAAQTVGWTYGDGTEAVVGEQIVVRGGAAGASPAPNVATPAPATPPPATPTPAPTNNGSSPTSFTNGSDYPTSYVPFSPQGPFASPLPATCCSGAQIASYSSTVINGAFGNGNAFPVRYEEPGQWDYAYAVVFAKSTDPVVNLSCNGYCDTTDNGGLPATIHIPADAIPPGSAFSGATGNCNGGDCPLAIIQPDGTEIDTAYSSATGTGPAGPSGLRTWVSGNTLAVGGAQNCGNWSNTAQTGWDGTVNTSGIAVLGHVTAGGNCLTLGQLRANELAAGHINHALKMLTYCVNGNPQYPVANQGAPGEQQCQNGNGPPLGARLYYDGYGVSCSSTPVSNSMGWSQTTATILCALHQYGAIVMDVACPNGGTYCQVNGSGGMFFLPVAGETYYGFGTANTPYASLPGWSQQASASQLGTYCSSSGTVCNRYALSTDVDGNGNWNPPGVNWTQHLYYLAPCVTQRTC